ncbi:unnamed protein product [Schistosoma turkestanicum]|nr:unnamed protein product [Schistosoma turkestanicum]
MFKYFYLLLFFSKLCGICQNLTFNTTTDTTTIPTTSTSYVTSKVASNKSIPVKGILLGVGVLTGILFVLILCIKCCKPDNLSNGINRIKMSFSHHDETKIWTPNLENETTQEYGTSQYNINTHNLNENAPASSSTSKTPPIIKVNASVNSENQVDDGNEWHTIPNDPELVNEEKM